MSRVLRNGEPRITQGYSWRHKAVDLVKAPSQLETIIAHTGGQVVFCQTGQVNNKGSKGNASYGNCVRIDHGNGYSTLYAHLSSVYVKYGQWVTEGQEIGYMGNTGNSYGGHLHFEVRHHNIKINPVPYLDADLPKLKESVVYSVHNYKSAWLPDVKDYNNINGNGYAGMPGKGIDGLKVRTTKKNLKYRVHTKLGWLDWVSKVDNSDNGYAGIYGQFIDGVQIEGAEYRVHLINGGWLPWVTQTDDSDNGYAGIYGRRIDKIQVRLK